MYRVCRHRSCLRGLLLLAGLLALGSIVTARAATVQVTMQSDLRFHPNPVNVAVGDSIVWVNQDLIDHTSTSGPPNCVANGTWNSGLLAPGAHFGRRFPTNGNFQYFCEIHCNFGMVGTVVVASTPVDPLTWAQLKNLYRK